MRSLWIQDKFAQLQKEKRKFGHTPASNALTNIYVDVATTKRPSREFRDQAKKDSPRKLQSEAELQAADDDVSPYSVQRA